MGGQACVFYGAAEFSRDVDLAVLCDTDTLSRVQNALDELQARVIAVPPFDSKYLLGGHAVHFRCSHPEADKMRVDLMSVMRGVAPFPQLWERRTTIEDGGETYDLLALDDLVRAKKTQRDKDWPMLSRLVENNYLQNRLAPTPARVEFWLRELRTPLLISEAALLFPAEAVASNRRAVRAAVEGQGEEAIRAALLEEQEAERVADREYWLPLRAELEALRLGRR
jgi:hypothetical protein